MAGAFKPDRRRTPRGPHSAAAKRELRTASVDRIRAMLAAGPMSTFDIADQLGVSRSGAYTFLRHMAIELREVRKSGGHDAKGREQWELGEDVTLPTADELLEANFVRKARTVPARQIGMRRDHLVAALFGPARGAVA